jgi:hypothetical protein
MEVAYTAGASSCRYGTGMEVSAEYKLGIWGSFLHTRVLEARRVVGKDQSADVVQQKDTADIHSDEEDKDQLARHQAMQRGLQTAISLSKQNTMHTKKLSTSGGR